MPGEGGDFWENSDEEETLVKLESKQTTLLLKSRERRQSLWFSRLSKDSLESTMSGHGTHAAD
jgi:hypothetical protein